MTTQTVNVRIATPTRSGGGAYTAPITMPRPPFDVPTERDVPNPEAVWVFKSTRGRQ